MLAPLLHSYSASVCRSFVSRAPAQQAQIDIPLRPALRGPSPEHGDDDRSPEHMLLSSLGLCMLTTFEAFAARDGIDLLAWRAKVTGTVEHTPEGPNFSSIVVELDIDIAGNVDGFEDALEDAKRCCLVQNALRVPVVVETQLHTPYDAADELGELRAQPVRELRGQLHAV